MRRLYLVVVFVYCLLGASTEASSDKAIACLDIAERDIRLICYDREIGFLKTSKNKNIAQDHSSTSNSRKPKTVAIMPPKKDEMLPSASLGNKNETGKNTTNGQTPDPEKLTIISVRKSIRGHWLITLNNGETWTENEPSQRPLKVNQVVSIKRGPMNQRMILESGRVIFVRARN